MRDIIREEARLIILRDLFSQPNYSNRDVYLMQELESYSIKKSREWVREEMRYLERVGAVKITTIEDLMMARLLPKAVEHLEDRIIIEGVKRPTQPRD